MKEQSSNDHGLKDYVFKNHDGVGVPSLWFWSKFSSVRYGSE